MKITRDDKNIHYNFSPRNKPILEISAGEHLTIETREASNGQLRPNHFDLIDKNRLLPLTGPIALKDAKPGDVISVSIISVKCANKGFAWIRPGLGIQPVKIEEPYYVKEINVNDGIQLSESLRIPLKPMVGILGVCPLYDTPSRIPGLYGGNLDCSDVSPGNRLWLPVIVPGANLSIGDVHAAMGDGEVSGTGVEIDAEVTISVDIHRGIDLLVPVITTKEKTIFLASSRNVELASVLALKNSVATLAEKNKLSEKDAYIVASISGNVRVCQLVNGDVTVGFELPSEVLKW